MAPSSSRGKALYTACFNAGPVVVGAPVVAAALLRLRDLHLAGALPEWEPALAALRAALLADAPPVPILAAAAAALLLAYALYRALLPAARKVYLVDFAVHKGLDAWKFPKEWFLPQSAAKGKFTEDDLQFQEKILMRSGLGDETYVPPWLYSKPPHYDMAHARKEFEVCVFSAVAELLDRTATAPRGVDIVITNCSLFNPTPSLAATVMNHFKMRSDVISYNLGGMGCSAGVVAVDLARQLLQTMPNATALVVSHENLTSNWYPGSDRSMLVPNAIFRSNGAAVLLSNKRRDARRAAYELRHVVRTTVAASEEAFQCVYQCEDATGVRGVRLGKELMAVAGRALKLNISTLGPRVLPLSEQLLFAANAAARAVLGAKRVPAYVPDFAEAFQHICLHTGGRAVLDTMEKALSLSPRYMEPSRAGLYRFGNVSSTSIWYVLAFIETFRGVRKGDAVWQLGFGSGFKVNSAVWVARRRVARAHGAWEGFDVEAMRAEFAAAEAEKAAYLAGKQAATAAAGKAGGK